MDKMSIFGPPSNIDIMCQGTVLGKCYCCFLIVICVKDQVLTAAFSFSILCVSSVKIIGSPTFKVYEHIYELQVYNFQAS